MEDEEDKEFTDQLFQPRWQLLAEALQSLCCRHTV